MVVSGIASPWCVENTTRRAFGLGYKGVLAEDAHGCADGSVFPAATSAWHHNEDPAACFATVVPVEEIVF